MAKETYKIVFLKDSDLGKAGTTKTGLSFNDQAEFMMANFSAKKDGTYKIEPEQVKAPTVTQAAGDNIKKTDTEVYKENLEIFMDSLSATDILAVKSDKKRICHNSTAGFYLKDNKGEAGKNEEIHVTMAFIKEKEKREIYKAMKAYLMGNTKTSWSQISGRIVSESSLFNEDDLRDMAEDLFREKC